MDRTRREGTGLLAVHAHPDDETLATGALLATWTAAGWPVTVVTCTRGEQGEVIPPDLAHLADDGAALAVRREQELAGALGALGVTDHVFLDQVRPADGTPHGPSASNAGAVGPGRGRFVDSGMSWAAPGRAAAATDLPDGAFVTVPLEDAAGRLATVLVDRRPGVVVGYEPAGGYGHPDHVRAHEVMQRAVELAAGHPRTPHRVAVVLWAAVVEEDLRLGRAAIGPQETGGLLTASPDGPVASAVVPRDRVDLLVDLEPVRDRVLAALRAHRTQVVVVPTAPTRIALSNGIVEPLLDREAYRVASGSADAVAWPTGVRR